jgi:hypothetical protein
MPVLMPSPVFRWFVPAQNGTGLVPAAGYKAKFYAAGTDTAKTIYELDGTPYPSPANEAELNSEGFAGILLGPGNYKLVVTDPDDATVYTQDNITGDGSFGTGFCETVIATDDPPTNGLAQVDTANKFTWCGGYWAIGDGGHGFFWNEESNNPEDGGYVIESTFDPTRRWFREQDEDGWVRAMSFGYVGTRAELLTNELLAAASYCQTNSRPLRIGPGDAATFGVTGQNYSLYVPACHFEEGAVLTTVTGVTEVRIYGIVTGPDSQIFEGPAPILFPTSQVLIRPEWFGASVDAEDNTAALNLWFASMEADVGAYQLPPGNWEVDDLGAIDLPTAPLILLGAITAGEESLPVGARFPADSKIRVGTIEFPNDATFEERSTADGEFSGRLYTSGLESSQDIIGTDITAVDDVTAGGDVIAHLGTGTGYFGAAGAAIININAASTSGGGLDNLANLVLVANSLNTSLDRLKVVCAGTITDTDTGSDRDKRFVVTLGGQTVFDQTIYKMTSDAVDWGAWRLEIDIVRAAGTFQASGSLISGFGSDGADVDTTGLFQQSVLADYRTASVDWTTNLTLQCAAEVMIGGTITQTLMFADAFPWRAP